MLGFFGSLIVSRRERDATARARLVDTYAEFLAATYQAVAELRSMPPARETESANWIDRLIGAERGWVLDRLWMERTGGRTWVLADRLTLAIARLQVVPSPSGVDEAIQLVEDYIERLAEQRTEVLKAEWQEVYQRLRAVGKALANGDQGVGVTST